MLKDHQSAIKNIFIIFDQFIIGIGFFLAYFLRSQFAEKLYPFGSYLTLLPIYLIVWFGLLHLFGMYKAIRTSTIFEIVSVVVKSLIVGTVIFGNIVYVFKILDLSRLLMYLAFSFSGLFVMIEKVILLRTLKYFRRLGYNHRNLLLVGTGRRAKKFMKMLEEHKDWGFRIIGLIDNDENLIGKSFEGHTVLGLLNDIPEILHHNVVDDLIFVVPGAWLKKVEDVFMECETEGVNVSVAVDIFEPTTSRMKIEDMASFPLVSFESAPERLELLFVKRVMDVVISMVAMVLLSPIFLITGILVKLASPGPILYRQERLGLNGRRFTMYKFRTMKADADQCKDELLGNNEMEGPVFKIDKDPRITSLGKVLRKFSIDEFPQFFNVFVGDMSLVGPRPPLASEVDQYHGWHRRRLRMRPGISCLWQVNGRNKITDFNEWVKLDIQYIENWSLWLDIKILLKTVPVVLFGVGAK